MRKIALSTFSAIAISLILWALPQEGHAQWLDSLYVRLGDAQMDRTTEPGKAYLKFSIQVYRPVMVWNNNDYTLGASDFYLGRSDLNMSEIFSSIEIEDDGLHSSIAKNSSKALKVECRFVLGKAHVFLTDNRLPLATKLEMNPDHQWITLCKVKMELRDPSTVEIGLVWDRVSSGMITTGNIPILEDLKDDLDQIPDKLLTLTDYSTSESYCEKEDIVLFAKAVSTGSALTYSWFEVENVTDGAEYLLDTMPGSAGKENVWETGHDGYQYQIRGKEKDTLVVRGAKNGVAFKCAVKDTTVDMTPRETPNMVVTIIPQVRVAFEGYEGSMKKPSSPRDSVFHCSGKDAAGRFAFYLGHITEGTTNADYNNARNRFRDQVGEIHISYKYVDEYGSETLDTLTLLSSELTAYSKDTIIHSAKSEIALQNDGTYFIEEVWTEKCASNGVILTQYDTVIIQSRNSQSGDLEPITFVAGSSSISVLEPYMTPGATMVEFLSSSVGELSDDFDYFAPAGQVGTDTLIYKYYEGTCEVNARRLIHVVSSKSVGIKVFLEGPYLKNTTTMRAIFESYFPGGSDIVSPYKDALRITGRSFPDFGELKVADWIFVEIWNYPPAGLSLNDPEAKNARCVDSTSALLLTDGTVASVTGDKYLTFSSLTEDQYYIVIKHKSHVPVMSAKPVSLKLGGGAPEALNTIDFTSHLEHTYNVLGESSTLRALKEIEGKFVLYAGDLGDDDGVVTISDFTRVRKNMNLVGYDNTEMSFDAQVTYVDVTLCQKNLTVYKKY
ncbi:hypothetical protein LJC12_01400 [Odoribacter sp. OttesenSCG-928-J03]|nr:hypothetical protein [Odoribacter sp. OttesenSCG-928-J03]MDL2330731.1 hypothetical protein [Odoribacter sp. OttesenSCG-928-A06]